MSPEELRTAIRAYLDKGPDFIKFGGTAHFARPSFIGFSPEAQAVIVEEAHRRGRVAETHATTADGLRLSIAAGIDLIQHPEMLGPRELPDALVAEIVRRKIVCSMLSNTITGEAWTKHVKDRGGGGGQTRGGREEGDGTRAAAHERGTASAGCRRRRRARDAADERAEADRRRRRGHDRHRQLLGRGAGVLAHAEAGYAESWHRQRSSPSKAWWSWG